MEPERGSTERARTILLIEDDETALDVTRVILEKRGYSVLVARTGNEAIQIAEAFSGDIDLAILDISLPDMDAKSVYTRIMQAKADMKVLLSSGYTIDDLDQEILSAGAQGFIGKPFTAAQLSEKLKRILGG